MPRKKIESFEPNPFLVDMGQRILKKRIAAGLHIDGLVSRTGLDAQNIVMIETGNRNPTILTLALIAHGLGVDLYTLLPGNSDTAQAEFAARDLREHLAALLEIEERITGSIATISRISEAFPTIRQLVETDRISATINEAPARPRKNRRKVTDPD